MSALKKLQEAKEYLARGGDDKDKASPPVLPAPSSGGGAPALPSTRRDREKTDRPPKVNLYK